MDKFAEVISDVLDTDVIIVDTHMAIIGRKFNYFSLYNKINYGSLISVVLTSGNKVCISNKADVPSCKKCKVFKECKMRGFIGIPIIYDKEVLGVLALILQKSKCKKMFEKIDSTVTFMENMASLIAKRIHEHNVRKSLKAKVNQIETIINIMQDALAYTDRFGNIIYKNKAFQTIFEKQGDVTNVCDIYPELQRIIRKGRKVENIKISIEYNRVYFYGTLTCEPILSNASITDEFLCCFRSYRSIQNDSVLFASGTLVTFSWLSKYIGKEITEKAKEISQGNASVLIESDDNAINELIAKAIINYSDRRLQKMKVIYMQNVYRDLMDSFLFDEHGLLWSMDKGTIVIVQPEKMLLHIQNKLAEYLKNEYSLIKLNKKSEPSVRSIFCTTENLSELVREGLFSRALYEQISKTTLKNVETVYNNKLLFSRFFESGIKYYNRVYGKIHADKTEDFFEELWNKRKEYDLGTLETLIEVFVKDGKDKIKISDEEGISFTNKEIEKYRLKELLVKGMSKKDICRILGYSRSTLYRKIKKYEFEEFG
ncbi:MAG: sigma 54-interacting transcriptional regulator [Catonella sp.]|uniref:sigma 54-interacting transcriptional regulator n=1 Tax=Catonella sp. TaxID=2382125 RepID=UPI003FA0D0BF